MTTSLLAQMRAEAMATAPSLLHTARTAYGGIAHLALHTLMSNMRMFNITAEELGTTDAELQAIQLRARKEQAEAWLRLARENPGTVLVGYAVTNLRMLMNGGLTPENMGTTYEALMAELAALAASDPA
jgi:hypothetical protein